MTRDLIHEKILQSQVNDAIPKDHRLVVKGCREVGLGMKS
jgi:hypothetical protein